jgi:uncharacterized HAD superfamily protein
MYVNNIAHLDKIIVDNIHKIRAIPFDVVVHIPRSGTIPASIIATYLCKPLASVEEYCQRNIITRKSDVSKNKDLRRILLVDDSIRTGKQMEKHVQIIKSSRPETKIYTLAAYDTEYDRQIHTTLSLSKHSDDMYIYPWFMWKTERIELCAVDMDGVLCRDCTKEEDDDGEKYLNFVKTAELKFKPLKHEIGAIVTSRLSKYRKETEEWLERNGIKYRELIMGGWKSNEDRKGNQAAFKAAYYKNSPLQLFVESSAREAADIHRLSGKSVYCIDSQQAFI